MLPAPRRPFLRSRRQARRRTPGMAANRRLFDADRRLRKSLYIIPSERWWKRLSALFLSERAVGEIEKRSVE